MVSTRGRCGRRLAAAVLAYHIVYIIPRDSSIAELSQERKKFRPGDPERPFDRLRAGRNETGRPGDTRAGDAPVYFPLPFDNLPSVSSGKDPR